MQKINFENLLKLKFLLPVLLGGIFLVCATSESAVPDLNTEVTLDLMNEISLPNVRRESRDLAEFGFMSRNYGYPELVTPTQTTAYDFSKVSAPFFGYRLPIAQRLPLSWSNRISYFDLEVWAANSIPARLHVVPLQTEFIFNINRARVSPFLAIGAVGVLQVQRGARLNSSEFAKLWSSRLGLDYWIRKTSESQWLLSGSWHDQKSFAESDREWAGYGYDISLSLGL